MKSIEKDPNSQNRTVNLKKTSNLQALILKIEKYRKNNKCDIICFHYNNDYPDNTYFNQ